MIPANELRIGNLVFDTISRKPVQINAGHLHDSECPEQFYPIELTPEMLVRFGFINGVTSWGAPYCYLKGLPGCEELSWDFAEKAVFLIFEGVVTSQPIRHLHILQNFFFFTYGKELEGSLLQD